MKILVLGNADQHPERAVKQKKFLSVLQPCASEIKLISGSVPDDKIEEIGFCKISHRIDGRTNIILTALNFLLLQLEISLGILQSREYDCIISFMGYPAGAIIGRALGMKTIRFHGGPSAQVRNLSLIDWFFSERLVNVLVDQIIVPSESCIEHFGLTKYSNKTRVSSFHVDDEFKVSSCFADREYDICYVGEMSSEKGVDILLEAVSYIHSNYNYPIRLVLCGQGNLVEEYNQVLNKDHIDYRGWVDHDQLPSILNDSKLFILLSESEGLPTVALESMACATPVLARPVGGVPDVVSVGTNGLLCSQADAEQVAKEIICLLDSSELEQLSKGASQTIDEKYRLQPTIRRFRRILEEE